VDQSPLRSCEPGSGVAEDSSLLECYTVPTGRVIDVSVGGDALNFRAKQHKNNAGLRPYPV
jgi:hypothetical protein